MPYIEETLIKAKEDEDDMWIGGINFLVEAMSISDSDFSNQEIYEILKLSDF